METTLVVAMPEMVRRLRKEGRIDSKSKAIENLRPMIPQLICLGEEISIEKMRRPEDCRCPDAGTSERGEKRLRVKREFKHIVEDGLRKSMLRTTVRA